MSTPSIPFYKLRDFSEKMTTTVEFLKENYKQLFITLILVGGPIAILVAVVFKDLFSNMFNLQDFSDPDGAGAMLANLGLDYFLLMSMTWIAIMMIIGLTYTIMIKYNNGDMDHYSVGEVFGLALKKLPGLLLLSFLIFVVTVIGFMLFVIPGIYLFIVFSLSYSVYLFEDASVGEAFSKPFTLINGKWWSTFGTGLIGYMMAYVIQIVFSIPFLFIYIQELFTMIEETPDDPTAILNMFSSGYMSFAMGLQYIGQYISLGIPMIALAYQYSNLVERSEGKGLLAEIEDFEEKN